MPNANNDNLTDVTLEGKDLPELQELSEKLKQKIERIETVIEKKRYETIVDSFSNINAQIKEAGFKTYDELKIAADEAKKTIKEINKKGNVGKDPVEPRYRSKIDPNLFWTGRGLTAKWIEREANEAGVPVEEYLESIKV